MAGIDVQLAVECEPNAAKTYRVCHPSTAVVEADVSNVDPAVLPPKGSEPTVLFAGPPCQGFSYLNTRRSRAEDPRNWLFREVVRFAKAWQPDWVVLENVRGFADAAGGMFLETALRDLDELGYRLAHGLLNAADFGVPQERTRYFIVGTTTSDRVALPERPSVATTTVADAISDLPALENGASASWLPYAGPPRSQYAAELRSGADGSSNHLVTRNADRIIERYRHVPPGGNWESIPAGLMTDYADRTRSHTVLYYRLRNERPAVVVGNYRKNLVIHPTQDRGLSVREAARLQSFPDWYEFQGSIGFQQQQVGNAVPPVLAAAVFASVGAATGNGKRG